MKQILFCTFQLLIFCRNWTSAEPVVGTLVRKARDNEFSSVVAIADKYFWPDLKAPQFCTGTLITQRHVLTAAHCIAGKEKEKVEVYGGSSRLRKCDRYDIQDWISYNHWAGKNGIIPEYPRNDIAIITLSRNTDQAKMTPAIISPEVSAKHEGLGAAVAGWGILEGGLRTEVLKTAKVRILNREECERRCSLLKGCPLGLPERFLCSTAKRRNPFAPSELAWATTSSGDSGGPLLFQKKILLAVNLGICPTGVEPHRCMNFHVGLNYYAHFIHHLTNEGLAYRILH